jgi:Putative DNA-binding domain
MAVTVQQIDVWRKAPSETQTLEFKEAKNQYDTYKLFSYCVAIANEGGGFMILGIKNKLPREVVATTAFPDLMKGTYRAYFFDLPTFSSNLIIAALGVRFLFNSHLSTTHCFLIHR